MAVTRLGDRLEIALSAYQSQGGKGPWRIPVAKEQPMEVIVTMNRLSKAR